MCGDQEKCRLVIDCETGVEILTLKSPLMSPVIFYYIKKNENAEMIINYTSSVKRTIKRELRNIPALFSTGGTNGNCKVIFTIIIIEKLQRDLD